MQEAQKKKKHSSRKSRKQNKTHIRAHHIQIVKKKVKEKSLKHSQTKRHNYIQDNKDKYTKLSLETRKSKDNEMLKVMKEMLIEKRPVNLEFYSSKNTPQK